MPLRRPPGRCFPDRRSRRRCRCSYCRRCCCCRRRLPPRPPSRCRCCRCNRLRRRAAARSRPVVQHRFEQYRTPRRPAENSAPHSLQRTRSAAFAPAAPAPAAASTPAGRPSASARRRRTYSVLRARIPAAWQAREQYALSPPPPCPCSNRAEHTRHSAVSGAPARTRRRRHRAAAALFRHGSEQYTTSRRGVANSLSHSPHCTRLVRPLAAAALLRACTALTRAACRARLFGSARYRRIPSRPRARLPSARQSSEQYRAERLAVENSPPHCAHCALTGRSFRRRRCGGPPMRACAPHARRASRGRQGTAACTRASASAFPRRGRRASRTAAACPSSSRREGTPRRRRGTWLGAFAPCGAPSPLRPGQRRLRLCRARRFASGRCRSST